jgi:hypothetical protein
MKGRQGSTHDRSDIGGVELFDQAKVRGCENSSTPDKDTEADSTAQEVSSGSFKKCLHTFLLTFLLTFLITGFIAETSLLKMEVAARPAATDTTAVDPAVARISFVGSGISISVAGSST